METWIALVVTTGGTIGGTATGAIIALKGARSLNKDERIAAERAENLRAFRLFVAEMVLSVSELRQLPPVPKSWPTDRVIELVERPLRGGKAGITWRRKAGSTSDTATDTLTSRDGWARPASI
jgi:Tfp pilus assembly protein PilX